METNDRFSFADIIERTEALYIDIDTLSWSEISMKIHDATEKYIANGIRHIRVKKIEVDMKNLPNLSRITSKLYYEISVVDSSSADIKDIRYFDADSHVIMYMKIVKTNTYCRIFLRHHLLYIKIVRTCPISIATESIQCEMLEELDEMLSSRFGNTKSARY